MGTIQPPTSYDHILPKELVGIHAIEDELGLTNEFDPRETIVVHQGPQGFPNLSFLGRCEYRGGVCGIVVEGLILDSDGVYREPFGLETLKTFQEIVGI